MRRYNPTNSKISVDEKGRVSFTEEISNHEDVQLSSPDLTEELEKTELSELKGDQILYNGDTFATVLSPNGRFIGITVDRAKGKGSAETSSGNSIPPKLTFDGMADTLYMDKNYFKKFLKEIKGLKM